MNKLTSENSYSVRCIDICIHFCVYPTVDEIKLTRYIHMCLLIYMREYVFAMRCVGVSHVVYKVVTPLNIIKAV